MLNVAVVDEDDSQRRMIVEALVGSGHRASEVPSVEAWVEESAPPSVDLLVVDASLSGRGGIALAKRFRTSWPQAGIIMLTGRDDLSVGYESGADICMVKPVSPPELKAAVSALRRRLRQAKPQRATIRLDSGNLRLLGGEHEVAISQQEAALLGAFIRSPDSRLERWQILEIFERSGWTFNRANVGVAIFRLGAKLRATGISSVERPIRAIRNWGYQLCERVIAD
ncbi:response regulator transcription factor [Devosia sp.]|uniref:response regulator transcription factor n=1 Tax=Devosia sp. TaxID=1871048 RepID=UPI003A94C5AC